MGLLAGLFHPDVATAQGDPRSFAGAMYPVERSYVSRATEPRRREFAAGRALARQAMASLGVAQVAIPAAADRAPVWPAGIVGSISHCSDWCVAAVARASRDCISIGIDVEPAAPLDKDLFGTVCGDEELRWLAQQPGHSRGLLAKAIFSAKESVYKAQYPLSREVIDFHAVSVAVDLEDGNFTAMFRRALEPFPSGYRVKGRIVILPEIIATGVALKHVKAEAAREGLLV